MQNRSSPRYCEADEVPFRRQKSRGSHWKNADRPAGEAIQPQQGPSFREDGMEDDAKPGYLLQVQTGCSVRWEQRRHERICGGISLFVQRNAPAPVFGYIPLRSHYLQCRQPDPAGAFPDLFVSSVKNPPVFNVMNMDKRRHSPAAFVCFRIFRTAPHDCPACPVKSGKTPAAGVQKQLCYVKTGH